MIWPVEMLLHDAAPDAPPQTVAVEVNGEPMALEVGGGHVTLRAGRLEQPDARLSGPPYAVLAVLLGGVPPGEAEALGLSHDGDIGVLDRLAPIA